MAEIRTALEAAARPAYVWVSKIQEPQ